MMGIGDLMRILELVKVRLEEIKGENELCKENVLIFLGVNKVKV